MTSTQAELRSAIVAEARRWIGTPFHHRQRQFGRGVDCINLLVAVYSAVGLIPAIELPWYPPDWALHRSSELIVETLKLYARPVQRALAGDVAVYGFGRCVSHAAIIEDDDHVIHAYIKAERVERTERSILQERLASAWTANRSPEAQISGYWSVFAPGACAAQEMIAA